jgi:hypothetical protein
VRVKAAEVEEEGRGLLEGAPGLPDTVTVPSSAGEAVGRGGEGLGDLLPPLPSLALGAATVAVAQAVALPPAPAPLEAVAAKGEADGCREGLPGRRVKEREGEAVAAAGEGVWVCCRSCQWRWRSHCRSL